MGRGRPVPPVRPRALPPLRPPTRRAGRPPRPGPAASAPWRPAARRRTPTARSPLQIGSHPGAALDGDPATAWRSDARSSTPPASAGRWPSRSRTDLALVTVSMPATGSPVDAAGPRGRRTAARRGRAAPGRLPHLRSGSTDGASQPARSRRPAATCGCPARSRSPRCGCRVWRPSATSTCRCPTPDIPVDAIALTRDPDRAACVLDRERAALRRPAGLARRGRRHPGPALLDPVRGQLPDQRHRLAAAHRRRLVAAAAPGGRVQRRRPAGATSPRDRSRPATATRPRPGSRPRTARRSRSSSSAKRPAQRGPGRGQPGSPGVAAHPGAAPAGTRSIDLPPGRRGSRRAAPTLDGVEVLAADPGVGDGLLRPGSGVRAAGPGDQRHQARRPLAQAAPGAPAGVPVRERPGPDHRRPGGADDVPGQHARPDPRSQRAARGLRRRRGRPRHRAPPRCWPSRRRCSGWTRSR